MEYQLNISAADCIKYWHVFFLENRFFLKASSPCWSFVHHENKKVLPFLYSVELRNCIKNVVTVSAQDCLINDSYHVKIHCPFIWIHFVYVYPLDTHTHTWAYLNGFQHWTFNRYTVYNVNKALIYSVLKFSAFNSHAFRISVHTQTHSRWQQFGTMLFNGVSVFFLLKVFVVYI